MSRPNFNTLLCAALGACSLLLMPLAHAETATAISPDNQASVRDDGLGVELRFDAEGQLLSVKSTYLHPVEFPDRRGINKAYIIAEEKAKANIARYMSQVVTSSRYVDEIDDSLSEASRSRGEGGESWSKTNTRKVIETLREVTGSSSSAILSGVRILERSYDEKDEEVTVVVGINQQSMSGAQQLGTQQDEVHKGTGSSQTFPSTGSESQRAKDFDQF